MIYLGTQWFDRRNSKNLFAILFVFPYFFPFTVLTILLFSFLRQTVFLEKYLLYYQLSFRLDLFDFYSHSKIVVKQKIVLTLKIIEYVELKKTIQENSNLHRDRTISFLKIIIKNITLYIKTKYFRVTKLPMRYLGEQNCF